MLPFYLEKDIVNSHSDNEDICCMITAGEGRL